MLEIRFNKDYNHKLECRVFTTIRHLQPKYSSSELPIGSEVICINDETGEGFRCKLINRDDFRSLHDIPTGDLEVDTGEDNRIDAEAILQKIYQTSNDYVLLTFKKLKK
jgi:hypothetical protein